MGSAKGETGATRPKEVSPTLGEVEGRRKRLPEVGEDGEGELERGVELGGGGKESTRVAREEALVSASDSSGEDTRTCVGELIPLSLPIPRPSNPSSSSACPPAAS